MACGILVPWPEIEPVPLYRQHEVLTTGPPGRSPCKKLLNQVIEWIKMNEILKNNTEGKGSVDLEM